MSKVDNYYVRHFHTDSLANGVLRDSSEIYTNKNLFITGYEITLKPLSEGTSIVENMTMDNYITLIEDGGVADTYCFPKGSYELSELVAEINELLNNRDNYYCELSIFVSTSSSLIILTSSSFRGNVPGLHFSGEILVKNILLQRGWIST